MNAPAAFFPAALRSDKTIGFAVSLLLHAALLLAGGFVLAAPVEYAVESGGGGIEISLTAAPAEPAAPARQESAEAVPLPKDPEDPRLAQNEIEEASLPPAEKHEELKQVLTAADSPEKGDGSSAVPGKDSTTFYSSGGAITEAKANYLKNPAPPYPWEARQKGWEGVVILKVFVDTSGHPTNIEKEQSSGYKILDESALNTVRAWSFRPARLGTLPVESSVRIPIRFELEGFKQR